MQQSSLTAATFKVGVCESAPELLPGTPEWSSLCETVAHEKPDLLLLNAMPFGEWIAAGPVFDKQTWIRRCAQHEVGVSRLGELEALAIAGTRPRKLNGKKVNEAFIWTRETGAVPIHTKQYFPNEEGFYEARWFEGGDMRFQLSAVGALNVGFQICTELMFNEHARQYGRAGAQLILVPRAVGKASLERWLVAMRMSAIVAGAYVASSNRGGVSQQGFQFGGSGWIVDPDGDLVARTTSSEPGVFHILDLEWVARAQQQYPCYVPEIARR